MTKFTVEYARTVRLKQYESLRLGMSAESTSPNDNPQSLFEWCKKETEAAIKRALEELKR